MSLSPSPAMLVDTEMSNSKAEVPRPTDVTIAPPCLALVPTAVDAPCMALVPFGRKRGKPAAKAAHIRKTIEDNLKLKSSDEFKAELLATVEASEQSIAKVAEIEKARDADVQAAQEGYEAAQGITAEAFGAHLAAARVFKEAVQNRILLRKNIDERGDNLLEAKKKLAMLQVLKENQVTMRRLQEQRELAVEAAREAKRNLIKCRQQGKHHFESAVKQAKLSHPKAAVEVKDDSLVATVEERAHTASDECPPLSAEASPAVETSKVDHVPALIAEKMATVEDEAPKPLAVAAVGGA